MSYSYSYLEDAQYRALVLALCRQIDGAYGVYVDLGPQHPGTQSLTSPLYERGWKGLNLEPMPQYLAYLNTVRPQDTNVPAVAGALDATLTYISQGPAGWQLAPQLPEGERANGQPLTQVHLQQLLDKQEIKALQLLRLGQDYGLALPFESLDWKRLRPWVVVLEPGLCSRWAEGLGANSYVKVVPSTYAVPGREVWVASEHPQLAAALQTISSQWQELPPNPVVVAQKAADQEMARKHALAASPLWVKAKVAYQERRVMPAVKARVKKVLAIPIRAALRHAPVRELAYALTRKHPHLQTRLRFMSPHPKPLYTEEVAALLGQLDAHLGTPSTDLKA